MISFVAWGCLRPFLADPFWVRKAAEGRADEINTCIGCNQACLDHTFKGKVYTKFTSVFLVLDQKK